MKKRLASVLALLTSQLMATALAQDELLVGSTMGGPLKPQIHAPDQGHSPEEVARDAAGDLRPDRFYNKPGATRDDYTAAWQACRLISRGSETPELKIMHREPQSVADVAGAGIGFWIAATVLDGRARRKSRQSCLLYKGWRLVEPPAAEASRVRRMSAVLQAAHFDSVIGRKVVEGKVSQISGLFPQMGPDFKLEGVAGRDASLWVGKNIDPKAPIKLSNDQGAVVLVFWRHDPIADGKRTVLNLLRYDVGTRDFIRARAEDKISKSSVTFEKEVKIENGDAEYEIHIVPLTEGDYVISGSRYVNDRISVLSNCFGMPVIHVPAGKVVYLGDWTPLENGIDVNGMSFNGLYWSRHLDEARDALAQFQPDLAVRMEQAELHNGATFACSAVEMTRWDLPGIPALPELPLISTGKLNR